VKYESKPKSLRASGYESNQEQSSLTTECASDLVRTCSLFYNKYPLICTQWKIVCIHELTLKQWNKFTVLKNDTTVATFFQVTLVHGPWDSTRLAHTDQMAFTVFVRLRACHATTHSYFTWPWPGLDSVSYSGCSVVPSVMG